MKRVGVIKLPHFNVFQKNHFLFHPCVMWWFFFVLKSWLIYTKRRFEKLPKLKFSYYFKACQNHLLWLTMSAFFFDYFFSIFQFFAFSLIEEGEEIKIHTTSHRMRNPFPASSQNSSPNFWGIEERTYGLWWLATLPRIGAALLSSHWDFFLIFCFICMLMAAEWSLY